ncbi:MAG: cytochrome P450 [Ktedonobacteraceae bacterium]|nr:cytochrome P450 [Ktedonobacteraceae bacterium]
MTTNNPSLGMTYDPFDRHLENPYSFYTQLRHEEPITFSPCINAYLVSRYDDIHSILSQPDTFSSKDTLTPGITMYPRTIAELSKGYPFVPIAVNADGANHVRLREPLQKMFAPVRIRTMEPLIRQIVTRLVDAFINDGHAEIISQLAYPLPLEVVLTLLGVPQKDMEEIKRLSDDWNALILSPMPEERQVAHAQSLLALHRYIVQLIEQRRSAPREDGITDLLNACIPGEEPLSEAELIHTIAGVILAGYVTTTNLIGNGLVLLLEEPTRWQTLCEHPDLIPSAIEEILRYHDPVPGLTRTTTREVTVGGVVMPAGTKLFLLYSAANRDETQFPLGDQFDMQRKPNRHLAFGYGGHFCVGAPLGRLEGRITFEMLTQRLPGMRLVANQKLSHVPNLIHYGYQSVEVEW